MTFGLDLTVNLALIVSIGGALIGLIIRTFRAHTARIDEVEVAADEACEKVMNLCRDHAHRLGTLETHVLSLPKIADFHALQLSISELRGDMRETRSVQARLETVVQRVEDHLVNLK